MRALLIARALLVPWATNVSKTSRSSTVNWMSRHCFGIPHSSLGRGVYQKSMHRSKTFVKDHLDHAESLTDLHVPGCNFHGLQGMPTRYSMHVNGPWCITFEWEAGNALRVDLEQYH